MARQLRHYQLTAAIAIVVGLFAMNMILRPPSPEVLARLAGPQVDGSANSTGNTSGTNSCGGTCPPVQDNATSNSPGPTVGNGSCGGLCGAPGEIPFVPTAATETGSVGPQVSPRPATYSGHYWTGAEYSIYSSQTGTATSVYTTIGTPSSGPRFNDAYYELLSAWDSNGYYDQIGVASFYCTQLTLCQITTQSWTIAISQGWVNPSDCGNLTFAGWSTATLSTLGEYQDYTFEMSLTGTNLKFSVFSGTGLGGPAVITPVSKSDSASNFLIKSRHLDSRCPGGGWGGFTVYQEVFDTSSTMNFPQWNSGFAYTTADTSQVTSWVTYNLCAGSGCTVPTSPHGYWEDFNDSNQFVRIDNVAFWINFPSDNYNVAQYSSFDDYPGTLNAEGNPTVYCAGTSCPVTWSCTFLPVPPAYPWEYVSTYAPAGGLDYGTDTYGSALGWYYKGCTVTETGTSPIEFSSFIFYVDVT